MASVPKSGPTGTHQIRHQHYLAAKVKEWAWHGMYCETLWFKWKRIRKDGQSVDWKDENTKKNHWKYRGQNSIDLGSTGLAWLPASRILARNFDSKIVRTSCKKMPRRANSTISKECFYFENNYRKDNLTRWGFIRRYNFVRGVRRLWKSWNGKVRDAV